MRISDWSSDVCSSDLVFTDGLTDGEYEKQPNHAQSQQVEDRYILHQRTGNRAAYVGSGSQPAGLAALTSRRTCRRRGWLRSDFALRARKRVVWDKGVSERVDFGGSRCHKKNNNKQK